MLLIEAASDTWTIVIGETLPPVIDKPLIVGLEVLTSDKARLTACGVPVGVQVDGAQSAESLESDLHWLGLVVIDFPRFRDGRGFTLARTLRERYGFTGEIRAQGNLLPDQLPLLQRCGFSSVTIPPERRLAWAAAEQARLEPVRPAAVPMLRRLWPGIR